MDDGFYVHINNMGELVTMTDAEPTMQLRWSKSGILQQAFIVTTYNKGRAVAREIDWRDIPKEDET